VALRPKTRETDDGNGASGAVIRFMMKFIGGSAPGTYILHTGPTQVAGRAAGGALGGVAYGAAGAARALDARASTSGRRLLARHLI